MYNAIVTGASSGIGKAIYEHLKKSGGFDKVIGISRRGPDLKMDLTDYKNFSAVLQHSNLEMLVNCAGVMPLDEVSEERHIFDVNFWATYHMIESCACTLVNSLSKNACIINIASISGIRGDQDLPIYAASKAAVLSLTKSYAKMLAPNVRVNCISPGYYDTNLVPGETPRELIDAIPLGFEEKPEAICHVIDMIWRTRYLTGSNIVVDGGASL